MTKIKKFQEALEEYNRNSPYFIFFIGDIVSNHDDVLGRKYKIISSELKNELKEVFSFSPDYLIFDFDVQSLAFSRDNSKWLKMLFSIS